MKDEMEVVPRLMARILGRAVLTRRTSTIARDPAETYALTFIRVVGEEHVQAMAFGVVGRAPTVITDWEGTRRDGGHLQPLATDLDDYITRTLDGGELPRIWIVEDIDLVCIELMAQRYHRNSLSSASIRRLGWLCDTLAREAQYTGQQVLVNAVDVLRRHIGTGQQAIDNLHLDAVLAWLDFPPGTDPTTEAIRRAWTPLAAMLSKPADDRVERLRAAARRKPARRATARAEIETLLIDAVMREWQVLVTARDAFWRLGLQLDARLDKLTDASRRRLVYALQEPRSRASTAHGLARLLDEQEQALELAEAVNICGDPVAREQARLAGRVIAAEVVAVEQPRRAKKPCTLTLLTRQGVLRVRPGTNLQTLDGRVQGQVVSVQQDSQSADAVLIQLEVRSGFRSTPAVGEVRDWADTVVLDLQMLRNKAYAAMKVAQSPLVYGRRLPPVQPGRNAGPTDLLGIGDSLRR